MIRETPGRDMRRHPPDVSVGPGDEEARPHLHSSSEMVVASPKLQFRKNSTAALRPGSFSTRVPLMLRVLALVALTALLLAPGPVNAHIGGVDPAVFEAVAPPTPSETTNLHHVLVGGRATDAPWPIALLVLLAAVALARQRPRRVVATVLVLLVAILGLEAAVHSVHHALGGDDPVACPTASIAAHLHGTTVVALAVVAQVGAVAAPSDPLLALFRPFDPSQPRAPPFPLV
jgi:hypothetical protein